MTLQEAKTQLNSYYVQTNRYEFCRFDENGNKFIKIVLVEGNTSIIIDDTLVYYGAFSGCQLSDLSPLTLATAAKLKKPKGNILTALKQQSVVIRSEADLDAALALYRKARGYPKMSFVFQLYNNEQRIVNLLFNISFNPYIEYNKLTLRKWLHLNELKEWGNQSYTSQHYEQNELEGETPAQIKALLNPADIIRAASESNGQIFNVLYRINSIDSILNTI